MAELAGITEIAEMLGASARTVRNWVRRPDFPKPIETLATGRIWRRVDVATWAEEHRPKPGRPPKQPG
jgi:prophage regulatory protein